MPDPKGPRGARALPAHPDLNHLKSEAKDRLRTLRCVDPGAKLSTAQFEIAREYGFASWRQLRAEVDRHTGEMFGVLLLNDDLTPMEFVVQVLEDVFRKTRHEATAIMLGVHETGKGLCGVYGRGEAELMAQQVRELAEQKNFPLRCTVEPIQRIDRDALAHTPPTDVVVLVNDDPARMDFVALLLEEVFQFPPERASGILVRVRKRGWAFCGPHARPAAERIRDRVAELAAEQNCGVKCVLEPMAFNPQAAQGPIEDRLGLPRVVFSEVHVVVRFDGPSLSSAELFVADIRPSIMAVQGLAISAGRKFDEHGAPEKIMARPKQNDQHIVFSFDPNLLEGESAKTGVDLARDIGLIGGSSCSLFKLIKWLSKPGRAELKVATDGAVVTLRSLGGEVLSVSQDVYSLALDPLILDNLGRLVEPLQKPGYEELSFMEDDCVVDLFTKADARSITDYLGRSGRT